MFFKKTVPVLILCLTLTSACSSLNTAQKRELRDLQTKNLEVKEKDPTTAAVLNILPGIGDFYNGNPGYGVANLLLWPLSVLWAPAGGVSGAEEVNYYASKAYVSELENKKNRIKKDIEVEFVTERISKKEYYLAIQKIDMMPLIDFSKDVQMRDFVRPLGFPTNDRVPTSSNNK